MSTLASQLTGNLGALHVYTDNQLGDRNAPHYMKYWVVSEHPNPDSNDGGRIPFAHDLQAALQQHISGFELLLSEYAHASETARYFQPIDTAAQLWRWPTWLEFLDGCLKAFPGLVENCAYDDSRDTRCASPPAAHAPPSHSTA